MRYYVNTKAQSGGEHEVHTENCSFKPSSENRIYLGNFSNCQSAMRKAREHYANVDGCYFCCTSCHKK